MNLEEVVKMVTHLDMQTLVFMALTMWWFTRGIRSDLKEAVADMKAQAKKSDKQFAAINARTDALQKAMMDLMNDIRGKRR